MKIKLKDVLTLDFETFYSKEYSLSKKQYNTSSYIRDPLFYAQCVGLKDGIKKTVWYEHKDIPAALKKFGAKDRPIMAHNTQFDGFILSHHYDVVPPFYLCTLSMARALHGTLSRNDLDTVSKLYGRGGKVKPAALKKVKGIRELPEDLLIELAEYMVGDVDECYAIGKKQLAVFPQKELDLIDWTVRSFCDPVLQIDPALVEEELEYEINGKAAAQRRAGVSPELLQSAEKFAAALENLGVAVPMKISPTTNELAYAFAKNDLAFQNLLEHEDDRVVALVEARLATKSTIGETRARRMLQLAGMPVPVAYNYCGAHTTRWSGGNKLNFQNLQRQGYLSDGSPDQDTARLRRSILAPKGQMIVVADSAQIEARFNAWLSGQTNIVQAFADSDAGTGPDVYTLAAATTYGISPDQISKQERFIGKIATLGLGYQMGWRKYQATLAAGTMGPAVDVSDNEAQRIVRVYRTTNDKIPEMWARCEDILSQMIMRQGGSYKCIEWDYESIWMPNGLGLHYYALNAQYNEYKGKFGDFNYRERGQYIHTYGGKLLENIVQALCRVIVGEQLLVINARNRVVMMSHDENVALAKKADAKSTLKFMIDVMSTPPKWAPGLALNAEGGFDVRYSK